MSLLKMHNVMAREQQDVPSIRVSRKHRPRYLKRVLRPTHLMKTVYAWLIFAL